MWRAPSQPIIQSMFSDHVLRNLSRIRVAESRRDRRQPHASASGLTPSALRHRAAEDAPLTVRHATARDLGALERLAMLDSHRIPSGELYVAERGGSLVAAVSIDTGAVIADPFERTASVVEVLRLQAAAARPVQARAALPIAQAATAS
jgi:hypothetical protein